MPDLRDVVAFAALMAEDEEEFEDCLASFEAGKAAREGDATEIRKAARRAGSDEHGKSLEELATYIEGEGR